MAKASSPGSAYTVSDSDTEDFSPEGSSSPTRSGSKRSNKAKSSASSLKKSKAKISPKLVKGKRKASELDIEDTIAGTSVQRLHPRSYHDVRAVEQLQEDLLAWFESVREKRGMPWRKRYNPDMSMEEKGQRAYEIWVSEIMLQQTQVATVIAYWQRWIEKWPTIADLAKADVEEVNAMWRGLGYYRRARSLLAGAKTVMSNSKYKGRLPEDPVKLEKEIDGVGRYTAGAICSMAYGVRTPIVDGNVHRLLTRLLAIHATQTAPSTIKALWQAAQDLVSALPIDDERQGIVGDWNQALMELGSQVCKPVGPDCAACPLQKGCKAYSELSGPPSPPEPDEAICDLCEPISSVLSQNRIPAVTVFPMRKEKKASREEEEVVCVTEWRNGGDRRWLFIKRPEKGLLAGLFEPPTTPTPSSLSEAEQKEAGLSSISTILDLPSPRLSSIIQSHSVISSIPHIFSHINMTYHIQHLIITTPDPTPPGPASTGREAVWLDAASVEKANIGTGVKKVWAEIYGSWGSFESGVKKKAVKGGSKRKAVEVKPDGKVVKKVMMPMMPSKGGTGVISS